MDAPYEIWLWLAKRFPRGRCLKKVDDDGRQTTEAYVSYKLTSESSADVVSDIQKFTYMFKQEKLS